MDDIYSKSRGSNLNLELQDQPKPLCAADGRFEDQHTLRIEYEEIRTFGVKDQSSGG